MPASPSGRVVYGSDLCQRPHFPAQHRFALRRKDALVHDRTVSRIVMLSRSGERSSQPGAVSATEHAGCRSKPRHR